MKNKNMNVWNSQYLVLRHKLVAKYLLEPNNLTFSSAKEIFNLCGYFNINFRNTQMKNLSRRDPNKPVISNRLAQ